MTPAGVHGKTRVDTPSQSQPAFRVTSLQGIKSSLEQLMNFPFKHSKLELPTPLRCYKKKFASTTKCWLICFRKCMVEKTERQCCCYKNKMSLKYRNFFFGLTQWCWFNDLPCCIERILSRNQRTSLLLQQYFTVDNDDCHTLPSIDCQLWPCWTKDNNYSKLMSTVVRRNLPRNYEIAALKKLPYRGELWGSNSVCPLATENFEVSLLIPLPREILNLWAYKFPHHGKF